MEFNWCRDTIYGDQSLPLIGYESVCKRQRKNIPPRPPALSACFALVHEFLFLYFLSITRMTMRLMFIFPYHTEWGCISPWFLAREIWLDKLILPKNKSCNKFAHVSFSVVDRCCPKPTIFRMKSLPYWTLF